MSVVVKGCAYAMAHVPDFIRYGSKPQRDLEENPALLEQIRALTRSYADVLAYPPHQVFIGNHHPDELHGIAQPWYRHPLALADRHGQFGEIVPQDEFYGWLKAADEFNLVWLETDFLQRVRARFGAHPFAGATKLHKLGNGVNAEKIGDSIAVNSALPLYFDGNVVGAIQCAHDKDDALKAHVLMENLLAKASAALVLHQLLQNAGCDAADVDFVLECSETAIGDRYQRGGGSMGKAIAEMCLCMNASGHDVRAFCAAPLHALVSAAALVETGVYRNVVVVGGGCLAKVGMKYAAHLKKQMPILEDVLAGIAILVTRDDGVNPVIRMDCIGKHSVAAGSSQQAIMSALVAQPLAKIGMKMTDIDKYATEMHNPEITLPAGSGNTPYTNYKIMASLAALNKEIERTDIEKFVRDRGMPGFAPTQGHVPAAVPFLGHACKSMNAGTMKRAMFVAKGSPFLGRMSQLADGVSFLLEANPARK